MKHYKIFLIIFFCLFSSSVLQAKDGDSLNSSVKEKINNVDSTEKGLDLILIAGLGMAYDKGYWGDVFDKASLWTRIRDSIHKKSCFCFGINGSLLGGQRQIRLQ